MAKMASEEGIVNAFYSGFGPILAKQIPYTMAKFAVQGAAADEIYKAIGKTNKECTDSENRSVSLGSGVIAGVSAAIISHPADTLLSKINKAGAGGEPPRPHVVEARTNPVRRLRDTAHVVDEQRSTKISDRETGEPE